MFRKVPTTAIISVVGFVISIAALAASPLADLPFPCLAGIWFNVPLMFWLGFSLIVISIYGTFFETTRRSDRRGAAQPMRPSQPDTPRSGFATNLPMVLFFVLFFLSPVIREPNPRNSDIWQFLLFTQTISEQGRLHSLYGLTTSFHEYWPGLYLLGSVFSQVSGTDIIFASRILSIIFPVIMIVAVSLVLQRIVGEKRLLVYALLFYTTFFWPIGSPIYSPQYYSLVLYPLLVYLWFTAGSRPRLICSLLISIAIIVSHPVSTLVLLGMSASIWILSKLPPKKARFKFELGTIFFLVSFLAWGFLLASEAGVTYMDAFVGYLRNVYAYGISALMPVPSAGISFAAIPLMELYYTRITRYLPLLLSLPAMYIMARTGKYRRLKFLLGLMLGSFYTLPIWIAATGWQFWDRALFFAALPVSALTASYFSHGEAAVRSVKKRNFDHRARRFALVISIVFLLLMPFKFMQYFDESNDLYKDSEIAALSFLGRSDPGGSLLLTDLSFENIAKFFDPTVTVDKGSGQDLFFGDKYMIHTHAQYVVFSVKAEGFAAVSLGEKFSFPTAVAKLSALPTYNLVASCGTSVQFERPHTG